MLKNGNRVNRLQAVKHRQLCQTACSSYSVYCHIYINIATGWLFVQSIVLRIAFSVGQIVQWIIMYQWSDTGIRIVHTVNTIECTNKHIWSKCNYTNSSTYVSNGVLMAAICSLFVTTTSRTVCIVLASNFSIHQKLLEDYIHIYTTKHIAMLHKTYLLTNIVQLLDRYNNATYCIKIMNVTIRVFPSK